MLRYTGSNEKVKLQVTLPDGSEYTYPVTNSDTDSVYSLPGGSGSYKITLLESVSVENNLYAISFTQDLDVTIRDDGERNPQRIYITDSIADGPAYNVGIQNGDILTKIRDTEIQTIRDFQNRLEDTKTGDSVKSYGKNGSLFDEYKEIEYQVTIGAR